MLGVNLDVGDLASLLDLKDDLKRIGDKAAGDLAKMIHGRAIELAGEKLTSRREMYIQGLGEPFFEDGVWVVSLDAKVRWIDDGLKSHSMLEGMLASKKPGVVKRANDGSRYVIVPFTHGPGKGPTNSTPAQLDLASTLQAHMKSRKIPWGTIEKHPDGTPKLGRLHSFDIKHLPTKTAEGPGQGRGPIGDVRQGPNARQIVGGGPSGGGIPFLQGVNVYQKKDEKSGKVSRQVMTFRIASEKHRDQARWQHPGQAPLMILDEAAKWAMDEWSNRVAPDLFRQMSLSIK